MAKAAIDIDINDIFYQLHEIAVAEAQKVSPDIDIQNLGVDDRNKSFIGAGEFQIIARASDENNKIPDKNVFVSVIRKYIEFFIGEDQSKKIKDDDCQPLQVQVASNESKQIVIRPMLEALFLNEDIADDDTKMLTVGYTLPYEVELEGQKKIAADEVRKWHLKNSAKFLLKGVQKIGKSMLGSIFSDIGNLKLKTGSGEIDIGGKLKKVASVAADAVKSLYNSTKDIFVDKDLEAIRSDFDSQFDKDFPNNRVLIKLYKSSILVNQLRQQNLLTADVSQRLSKLDYCLAVIVKSNDTNYPEYSQKTIAAVFTKAFGKYTNLFFKGGITADKIIKIQNFNTNFKNKRDNLFQKQVRDSQSIYTKLISNLFNGKLLVETKLTDAKKQLIDYIEGLDIKDRQYALDFFEKDQSIKPIDVISRSYTSKKAIVNKILSKPYKVMKTAINTYHPANGIAAIHSIQTSLENAMALKRLAVLLDRLAPDAQKRVFNDFITDVGITDEDIQSIATTSTASSSTPVRKVSTKSGLSQLLKDAVKNYAGKPEKIQAYIYANYKPEKLGAFKKIYDALNNVYKFSTGKKSQGSAEDMYIIDRNLKYKRDPHQREEQTKGGK